MAQALGLTRDGKILLSVRAARNFAFGFIGLILILYLPLLNYNALAIGVLLSLTLVGSTISNVVVGVWSNVVGRRAMLVIFSLLMVISSIVLIFDTTFYAIALALLVGSVSSTGSDVGPFTAIEQAALVSAVSKQERNVAFSYYNITSRLAALLGAVFFGLEGTVAGSFNLSPLDSYRVYFVVYAALSILLVLLYGRLSSAIESRSIADAEAQPVEGEPRSKRRKSTILTAKLSGLFMMDGLGQGFVVQTIVAFWFKQQFNVDAGTLASVFVVSNATTLFTYYVAARVANAIGLIKTIFLVSVPANICLLLIPLAPTFLLSSSLYVARVGLSRMDEPTRQSYAMSVVAPEHRAAAAASIVVTNTAAQAVGPTVAGSLLQSAFVAEPFFIASAVKLTYNALLYASFRNIHE